jgi:late competence protein required for DNA uptake (superfamily II DNA/RNA helicase)
MVRCPSCQSRDIGKIGSNQYYCWNCFIELSVQSNKKMHVYQVEEDGSLSSLDDLFLDGNAAPKAHLTS